MSLTRYGVCHDLKKTPFKTTFFLNDHMIVFHFSSEFNMRRFEERIEEYKNKINESISKRFKIDIDMGITGHIKLYSDIENRGFFFTYKGIEFTCLENVKIYHQDITRRF